MLLNAQQIIETCEEKEIEIIPFEDSQVEAATYDLRVGPQGATTSTKKLIDVRRQSIWDHLSYFLRDTFLPMLSPV